MPFKNPEDKRKWRVVYNKKHNAWRRYYGILRYEQRKEKEDIRNLKYYYAHKKQVNANRLYNYRVKWLQKKLDKIAKESGML